MNESAFKDKKIAGREVEEYRRSGVVNDSEERTNG